MGLQAHRRNRDENQVGEEIQSIERILGELGGVFGAEPHLLYFHGDQHENDDKNRPGCLQNHLLEEAEPPELLTEKAMMVMTTIGWSNNGRLEAEIESGGYLALEAKGGE